MLSHFGVAAIAVQICECPKSIQTFKIDENLTRSNGRYSTQNQNVVDGVHVRGSGDSDRKCRVKFIIKRRYRLLVH